MNLIFLIGFLFSLTIPVGLLVLIVQRIRLNQRLLGEDREALEDRILDELDILRTQLEMVSRKLDRVEGSSLEGAAAGERSPGPESLSRDAVWAELGPSDSDDGDASDASSPREGPTDPGGEGP